MTRARRWTLLVAACLALGAARHAAAAIDESEDEVVSGRTIFGVPEDIMALKRQQARDSGFSWVAGATAFLQNDDNLFLSPDALRHSGGSQGGWGYLRGDGRWGTGNRFLSTATWSQSRFPGNGLIDASHGTWSNWYERRLGKRALFELDTDLSLQNDDAATVEGLDYSRTYAYKRFSGEGVFEWHPDSHHRIRTGVERVLKNYDETPGLNTLDWGQWRYWASYRFRFAPYRYLTVEVQDGERKYDEEPAGDVTGRELPGNPAEDHRYQEFSAAFSTRLGARARADLEYTHTVKRDLFQSYESNAADELRLGAGMDFGTRAQMRLDAARLERRYEHILGDARAPVHYERWDLTAGARVRVLPGAWVFGSVQHVNRDSNKSTGTLYLDYRGTTSRGGVSVYF